MSKDNVEIFQRGIDAWNRDDLDAWIRQFDPEVEWFALMEVFRGQLQGRCHLTVRMDDCRDLGEAVLGLGELIGMGRTTQLNVTVELAQLVTFRRGRMVTLRDFPSHAEGLKAAGLRG
jgi:ketosteroid isomerase-like protein